MASFIVYRHCDRLFIVMEYLVSISVTTSAEIASMKIFLMFFSKFIQFLDHLLL